MDLRMSISNLPKKKTTTNKKLKEISLDSVTLLAKLFHQKVLKVILNFQINIFPQLTSFIKVSTKLNVKVGYSCIQNIKNSSNKKLINTEQHKASKNATVEKKNVHYKGNTDSRYCVKMCGNNHWSLTYVISSNSIR